MRNLVVGANSILGQELIGLLSRKGGQVTGIYHRKQDNLAAGIEYHSVDRLHQLDPDYDNVFVISAFIPDRTNAQDGGPTGQLFDANVLLVRRICERFPGAKIVYTSSVSVYGGGPAVMDEESYCDPSTEYAVSKLWGERIVGGHPRYGVVRVSSMYGPGMKETTFLPYAVGSALKKGVITLFGDGSRAQNYIHAKDVASCLSGVADSMDNGVYLATGLESVSNLAVAEVIRGFTGCGIAFEGMDATPSSYYNNATTRRLTGFQPAIDLVTGINELIEWKRKMY